MVRFVSHYTNRLDAKGRVSIPAPFRAAMLMDGFGGLYLYPCLDGCALDCGGNALLRDIETMLELFLPYSQERETLAVALMGTSEILKIDTEGRIILTETLKNFTGITTEVAFVGVGHKFQIWEPSAFRLHLAEAKDRLRTLRLAQVQIAVAQQDKATGGERK